MAVPSTKCETLSTSVMLAKIPQAISLQVMILFGALSAAMVVFEMEAVEGVHKQGYF